MGIVRSRPLTEGETLTQLSTSSAVRGGATAVACFASATATAPLASAASTASAAVAFAAVSGTAKPSGAGAGEAAGSPRGTGLRSPSHEQIWGGHDLVHVF